jgi:hypothetical protein
MIISYYGLFVCVCAPGLTEREKENSAREPQHIHIKVNYLRSSSRRAMFRYNRVKPFRSVSSSSSTFLVFTRNPPPAAAADGEQQQQQSRKNPMKSVS